MDGERWDQIQSVFLGAVNRSDSERMDWLQRVCATDGELMTEVLAMVEADSARSSLMDRGLSEMAFRTVGVTLDLSFSQEFGPYRLKHLLGEGGMGAVWLAERVDAGNPVAIKFLPHAGLSPSRRGRFAAEIQTLAKLTHPFIARLYDAGTLSDGTPWFVMEYVQGISLNAYCREWAPSIEHKLQLFRSVCEAVRYAHGQEVIHRDLKPSNVMVEPDGTPKLLDFGIAKQLQSTDAPAARTEAILRFVSRDYAAPEWAGEGIVGPYTDVYSLGVILYEMLTSELPGPGATEGSSGKLSTAAGNELRDMCLKAMHRDAEQRYQSVEALIRDIDHYLNGQPLEARPDTWRYRTRKFVERNRVAVLATSAACALITCMIVLFALRLAKERNIALAEAARTERVQHFMLNLFQGEDKEAGPANDLRVVTLMDRGVDEARSLDKEPAVQAELYQTLGAMYQKLGRLDRADSLLQLALAERKALPEQDYRGLVRNLISLGLLRSDQGNSKQAEQIVRDALAIINAHEPSNNSLLEEANFALGKVLLSSGKYQGAAATIEKVVSLQSAAGEQSGELARTLNVLAEAHLAMGHYEVANSLDQRALAIDERIYGDRHPQPSEDLENLGQIQEMWGRYAEAEQYERQALRITRNWYGQEHPDTARNMTALAQTLIYEGKYQEADDLLQAALLIQERVYGPMHHSVAFVLNSLGSVANKRGDYKNAEADFRRAAEIYRSAYGDNDYRVTVAMANLASVYFKEKQYQRAEATFRDVVQRFTKERTADGIDTGIAEIKLGRTLLFEHRYREAEQYTRAGYEVLSKQTSPSTSFVEGARHDLAVIYAGLKQPEQARKFQDEPTQITKSSARPSARN